MTGRNIHPPQQSQLPRLLPECLQALEDSDQATAQELVGVG